MGDAYFGFYLLAMGRGRPRTAREIAGPSEADRVRPAAATLDAKPADDQRPRGNPTVNFT